MFKDKVYEEMDHLSKLIEEYDDALSDKLASLPKSIAIHGFSVDVMKIGSVFSVLSLMLNSDEFHDMFDANEINFLDGESIFQVNGESVYDNTVSTVDGRYMFEKPIIIEKTQHRLTESQILGFAAYRELDYPDNVGYKDLNDLIHMLVPKNAQSGNLMGLDVGSLLKSQSARRKKVFIDCYVRETIIKNNTWNIRNTRLFIDLRRWIYGTLCGNMACKANLMKLACMRHNGHGIYSIEEIV